MWRKKSDEGGINSNESRRPIVSRKEQTSNNPRLKSKGPYYAFTFLYGVFYITGAAIGYNRTESVLCISVSLPIGLVFMLLSIGHFIDAIRIVPIDPLYFLIPCLISMVVAILMTCFWALGAKYVPFGLVSIASWISFVFYIIALIKQYGKDLITGNFNDTYFISKDRPGVRYKKIRQEISVQNTKKK
jgi:hypothetical protein